MVRENVRRKYLEKCVHAIIEMHVVLSELMKKKFQGIFHAWENCCEWCIHSQGVF